MTNNNRNQMEKRVRFQMHDMMHNPEPAGTEEKREGVINDIKIK